VTDQPLTGPRSAARSKADVAARPPAPVPPPAAPTSFTPPAVPPSVEPRPSERTGRPRRPRVTAARLLIVAALIAMTVIFIYPFVWLVSASFKPRSQVFDNLLIPRTPTIENYINVWREAPMLLWLGNTVLVTVLAAVAVTLSSALVAWGFSYFQFRGRNALFGLVLATMMLPGAVTMVPTFLIWNSLGLVNTLAPLWAGNLFGSAFYIFLLRQFFLGLPRDTFEAARIDGANNWVIFSRVALPLTRPAVIVTLLFEFQAAWTDLMRPLIYLRDSSKFTVPRGLKALLDQFGFGGEWHWEIVVTASVITTVPMIILFFLGQRHFVQGIATTGAKG
jgi:multiple sugar transport system permease protein